MDTAISLRSGRRAFLAGSAALCLLLLSGCVRETTEGSVTSFRYELWVPIGAFLGGLVAVPLGWMIRKRWARYGWGLVVLGPLSVVFLAPSVFLDRVVLDDAGIHSRTGVWGMTAVHDVNPREVNAVKVVSETSSTRRGGKRTNYFFLCELKSGGRVKFPVNNAVQQAAAPSILRRLVAQGIPITDETGE